MSKYLVVGHGGKWIDENSKKISSLWDCPSCGVLDGFSNKDDAIKLVRKLLVERKSLVWQNELCSMCFEDMCESVDCEEAFKECREGMSEFCDYTKALKYESTECGFDIWCEVYTSHVKKLSEIERYSIKEIEDCSGKLIREFEVNLYDDEEWNFNK